MESVGSLLADIANYIADGQRILGLADKNHWGQDEYDLLRAFERTLDEAKKDFQELTPFIKGQSNYERDRSFDSIEELRALRTKFEANTQNVKDWSRSGGPVNPIWIRDTYALQKDLHRAQCRAARRVFTMTQETTHRCLGAFLVNRKIHAVKAPQAPEGEYHQQQQLEDTMVCNSIGAFERFGDQDVAFVCDFCDGYIVWEDLERVPTTRSIWNGYQLPEGDPLNVIREWKAAGMAQSNQEAKEVVFAPIAVANHIPPTRGDWQAMLLCPLCEVEGKTARDLDDEEDPYVTSNRFDDLDSLQEHMEWQHSTATYLPAVASSNSCTIM